MDKTKRTKHCSFKVIGMNGACVAICHRNAAYGERLTRKDCIGTRHERYAEIYRPKMPMERKL